MMRKAIVPCICALLIVAVSVLSVLLIQANNRIPEAYSDGQKAGYADGYAAGNVAGREELKAEEQAAEEAEAATLHYASWELKEIDEINARLADLKESAKKRKKLLDSLKAYEDAGKAFNNEEVE